MSHGQRPGAASAADVATRASVLRRLELDGAAPARRQRGGDHLTTALGPGSERAGARAYEPGDDARLIDWNLTARSARDVRAPRPRPSARSTPGSSSTARPASTSAPPAARSATSSWAPRRPSACSPCGGHNRLGVAGRRHRAARAPAGQRRARLVHDRARDPSTTPRARTARPADDADLAGALRRLLRRPAAARPGRRRLRLPRTAQRVAAAAARARAAPPGRRRARDGPARARAAGRRHARRRRHRDRTSAVRAHRVGRACAPVTPRPPADAARWDRPAIVGGRRRVPAPVHGARLAHRHRAVRTRRGCTGASADGSAAVDRAAGRLRTHVPGVPAMTFLSAWRLVLLVAPLALLVAYVLVQRRRHTQVLRFTQRRPARLGRAQALGLAAARAGGRRCCCRSSCSPSRSPSRRWRMRTPKDRATILLTLDTSASMTATDVAPSRLEAAEAAGHGLRRASCPTGIQVGLVTFDTQRAAAGAADRRTRASVLDALDLAGRGRRHGHGRRDHAPSLVARSPASRRATSGKPAPAVIVLMSDGSPTIGDGQLSPVAGGRRRGGRGQGPVGAHRHDRLRHRRRRRHRAGPGRAGAVRPAGDGAHRRRRAAAGPSPPQTADQLGLDLRPDRPRRRLRGAHP